MILVLGAVIVIIYACFALLKRISKKQTHHSEIINSVDALSLGSNKAVHIIEIGDLYYIIGASDQSVQLIQQIADASTINIIKQHMSEHSPSKKSPFKERINTLLQNINKPKTALGGKRKNLFSVIKESQNRIKNLSIGGTQ